MIPILPETRVKLTQEMLRVNAIQQSEKPKDLGPKPSPDSTECPYCHVWRMVEPYQATPDDNQGTVQHICPQCKGVDLKYKT